MSGLSNPESITYLQLRQGAFYKKVNAAGENTVSITGEDGVVRHFETYRQLAGRVTKIFTKTEEFKGKPTTKVCMHIVGGGSKFQIEIPTDSGYFRALCQQFFRCNPAEEISFSPVYSDDGTKKSSGMFLSQNGENVGFEFTQKDPGDAPEVDVLVKKSGEKVFDSSERTTWFLNKFNETNAKLTSPTTAALLDEPGDLDAEPESNPDDLPF